MSVSARARASSARMAFGPGGNAVTRFARRDRAAPVAAATAPTVSHRRRLTVDPCRHSSELPLSRPAPHSVAVGHAPGATLSRRCKARRVDATAFDPRQPVRSTSVARRSPMTMSTKESPVRVLRLPEISREAIARGLSEIKGPDVSKVERPSIEMPDLELSKVELPRVDVGKAVAGAAVAMGIARPAPAALAVPRRCRRHRRPDRLGPDAIDVRSRTPRRCDPDGAPADRRDARSRLVLGSAVRRRRRRWTRPA